MSGRSRIARPDRFYPARPDGLAPPAGRIVSVSRANDAREPPIRPLLGDLGSVRHHGPPIGAAEGEAHRLFPGAEGTQVVDFLEVREDLRRQGALRHGGHILLDLGGGFTASEDGVDIRVRPDEAHGAFGDGHVDLVEVGVEGLVLPAAGEAHPGGAVIDLVVEAGDQAALLQRRAGQNAAVVLLRSGQNLPLGLAPEQAVVEGGEDHVVLAGVDDPRHLVAGGAAEAGEADQAPPPPPPLGLELGQGLGDRAVEALGVGPPVVLQGAVGLVDHEDVHRVALQQAQALLQRPAQGGFVLREEGLGLAPELGGEVVGDGDVLQDLAEDGLALVVAGGGVHEVHAEIERGVDRGAGLLQRGAHPKLAAAHREAGDFETGATENAFFPW